MSEVQKPQRIDVSSYIEVITVKPKDYQKAIRTGEGNVINSLESLAFRGKKLSQNEARLAEEIHVPVSPTIQYKVNSNVINGPTVAFSLQFIKNVYYEDLVLQAFGQQPVLDNCDVGNNIYYDGEVNTEYSELGWNTYAVNSAGEYIDGSYSFDIEPIVYGDLKFGLVSSTARNNQGIVQSADPRIEQSYSNIPIGSPTDPPPLDYQLNQRISSHLQNVGTSITEGNNAYFKFQVHNDTTGVAILIVTCGANTQEINIRPGARNNITVSSQTGNNIPISITAKTVEGIRRVYVGNFSLCYELVEGASDGSCIGQELAFNGNFDSGLAGWATSGYVGLNGTSVEMSSLCEGYEEDPTITQIHYTGGPITPVGAVIQADDKIKLIADVENISTQDAEIYAEVNGKTKGYILGPSQRRIVTSSNLVAQDGIATSIIKVKTKPKTPPVTNLRLIAPISGDNWHGYNLFNKTISVISLKNASIAANNGIYAQIGEFIYTYNSTQAGAILRSNQDASEIFYQYAFFNDPSHIIQSFSSAGNRLMVVRRRNQQTFIDLFDTSTAVLLNTYEVSRDNQNNLTDLLNLIVAFDGQNNAVVMANYFSFKIYVLDLITGGVRLLSDSFSTISSIAVDPISGLYYVAALPIASTYIAGDAEFDYKLFRNENNIVGIDQFGVIATRTSLYRGDRPFSSINTATSQEDYAEFVPINSLTCLNIGPRKFIAWVRNELIIRNSSGFKRAGIFDSYGYRDEVGYNSLFTVYMAEYFDDLPNIISQATPAMCLHKRHLNVRTRLNFLEE